MIICYSELPEHNAAIFDTINGNTYVLISNLNINKDVINEINQRIAKGETRGVIWLVISWSWKNRTFANSEELERYNTQVKSSIKHISEPMGTNKIIYSSSSIPVGRTIEKYWNGGVWWLSFFDWSSILIILSQNTCR